MAATVFPKEFTDRVEDMVKFMLTTPEIKQVLDNVPEDQRIDIMAKMILASA